MACVDLVRLSAVEVLGLIKENKAEGARSVNALIAHIEARDSDVHAWVYLDTKLILENARMLDALPVHKRGPLHGLPVGIKDIFLTKDMPTEYNSPIYRNHHPATDAAQVAILRASGALIFGKTYTTQFASLSEILPTRNPLSLDRTPGASSSGSAAAVADFQIPLATGTQTGGSAIRPASFCGIYGLKPTFGAVSLEGAKTFSTTFDTAGFFARKVEDLQLLLSVFRLQSGQSRTAPLDIKSCTFAFARTQNWDKASDNLKNVWQRAQNCLTDAGAKIEEIDLPSELDSMNNWQRCTHETEGGKSFLAQYLINKDILHPQLQGYVENVNKWSKKDYLEATDGVARLRSIVDDIARQYTAIIAPSTADEAPLVGLPKDYSGIILFETMWTGLHMPVVNVPGFTGSNGLPVGLALIAPRFQDEYLLEVGKLVGKVFKQAKD